MVVVSVDGVGLMQDANNKREKKRKREDNSDCEILLRVDY